jgi:aspartyl-tRNA(Asn)/glutamyl-tRNA(Gln) amidotransferase subunit A
MDILNLSVKELSKKLASGELTSIEITKAYLEQIKKVDNDIHAFLTVSEKEALAAAQESDARRKEGSTLSALDGVPMALKDVLLTKDIRTTASAKMLENYIPLEDATAVKKLKEAGCILLGKNNNDAWAHGGSTENSDFGPTKNPWNQDHVPGGSSGGSAAAVAALEAPFTLGTDTGGSIRQPAGFCGVGGLKQTYGLVSRYGLIAMASSLDVVGPMAKTVEDAALVLSAIAGADGKDATSAGSKPKDYLSSIKDGVKGLKIGLPREYFGEGLDPEVKSAVMTAAKELEKAGAQLIDVSLPNTEYGIATYYVIQPAEVSSNLGRFDGVHYGYASKDGKNLIDHYFKSRSEAFGSEAKRRIMLGTYVLSAGYYEAYYNKAMKVRTIIKRDFEEVFKKVDLILGPTSPTPAFKFGSHQDDPLAMYLEDAYTVNANLAGIPALALPCGLAKNDLPIGFQLMGPHFSEDLVFKAGHAYEEQTKSADWRNVKAEV